MRFHNLSALLVAAALVTTPTAAAFAGPTTAPHSESTPATTRPTNTAPTSTDAADYAEREAKDQAIAEFEGGSRTTLAITGSTLTVLLFVLLIVIIL